MLLREYAPTPQNQKPLYKHALKRACALRFPTEQFYVSHGPTMLKESLLRGTDATPKLAGRQMTAVHTGVAVGVGVGALY